MKRRREQHKKLVKARKLRSFVLRSFTCYNQPLVQYSIQDALFDINPFWYREEVDAMPTK